MADTHEIEDDREGTSGFSPAYTSFRTTVNLIERMASEGGVPSRVDRSYLSNLPGSSQTILIASLRALGLIDAQSHPTSTLIELVDNPDERSNAMNVLLRTHYGRVIELAPNATQQQLEEAFREYGVTGSTMRKAIAFFIAAARFADLPLSPHFRTPKASAVASRPRKVARERKATEDDAPPPPPLPKTDLPTLVQGLVERLPKDGEDWTAEDAAQWLKIAELTFPYVYGFQLDPKSTRGGGSD